VSRLARQTLVSFTQAPRQIAWQHKPSTYFVCTDDLATRPEAQRHRLRAGTRIVEFGAGHHPFLSRPDEFAQIIVAAIDRS
jgi:pimeloyl-ACP methyl ester carboxylesterase